MRTHVAPDRHHPAPPRSSSPACVRSPPPPPSPPLHVLRKSLSPPPFRRGPGMS
jgi:hypothetical protein